MRHPEDQGGQDRPDQLGRDRTEGVERESPHHSQVFPRAPVRAGQEGGEDIWN